MLAFFKAAFLALCFSYITLIINNPPDDFVCNTAIHASNAAFYTVDSVFWIVATATVFEIKPVLQLTYELQLKIL